MDIVIFKSLHITDEYQKDAKESVRKNWESLNNMFHRSKAIISINSIYVEVVWCDPCYLTSSILTSSYVIVFQTNFEIYSFGSI